MKTPHPNMQTILLILLSRGRFALLLCRKQIYSTLNINISWASIPVRDLAFYFLSYDELLSNVYHESNVRQKQYRYSSCKL